MVCNDFIFDGYSLSDYGLASYNPDDEQAFVARELDKAEISAERAVVNHYSSHYSDTLSLKFLVIRCVDEYNTQEELRLTGDDINEICAWLQSPKVPEELLVLSDDEDDTHYWGVFTDIQPFTLNQECYGLYLTFKCNAPYGFSNMSTGICNINSTMGTFNIIYNNLSVELREYVKPIIKIYATGTFDGTETVLIINNTDSANTMSLTMPSGKDSLIIDCQKKYFCDSDGALIPMANVGFSASSDDTYNIISAESYPLYWLRLLPGANKLAFTTDSNSISKIEVCARFAKKAGGF